MTHPRFISFIVASVLFHAGAIAFVGPPLGATFKGIATPQALEVRLLTVSGDSDVQQTGQAISDMSDLPLATDINDQGQVPNASSKRIERALPESKQAEQSSRETPPESGTNADPSDNAVVETNLRLPKTYRSESELDIPPKALAALLPEFPANASAAGIEGKVVLIVFVGANGLVDDVKVVEATPPGYFETSAIAAAKGARFAPGYKAGKPVSSKTEIAIHYGVVPRLVSG